MSIDEYTDKILSSDDYSTFDDAINPITGKSV